MKHPSVFCLLGFIFVACATTNQYKTPSISPKDLSFNSKAWREPYHRDGAVADAVVSYGNEAATVTIRRNNFDIGGRGKNTNHARIMFDSAVPLNINKNKRYKLIFNAQLKGHDQKNRVNVRLHHWSEKTRADPTYAYGGDQSFEVNKENHVQCLVFVANRNAQDATLTFYFGKLEAKTQIILVNIRFV